MDISQIYMSYDDTDDVQGNQFKKWYSRSLREKHHTTIWSAQDVPDGAFTQAVMAQQMKQSFLFLVFISPDSLSSPRCLAELSAALRLWQEERIWIIPVLLRPTMIENPELEKLQLIPRQVSKGVVPLTLWRNQDEAYNAVYQSVLKVVSQLVTRRIE